MSDDRQDQGPAHGQWQAAGPSAGWYPDPWDGRRRRYWDGQAWTGDVSMEPPGNWAGERSGTTQVTPVQAAVQPAAAQWPAGYGHQPEQQVAQWGGGGWGGPPQHPAWYGQQGWPQPAPAKPAPGSRIHVALVALITLVAVVAGIGIGSQVNSSATARPSASSPSGGSTTPGLGGGTGSTGGTGSIGGTGSSGATGSTTLTPAQQAVAHAVDRSVVDVNTEIGYSSGAAAGTGMVLTPTGTVLTNNHVIDGATSISVTVVSTGRTYKAHVVGDDVTQDVAVIQMEGASGLTPIIIAGAGSVARGDTVLAIGNAGGAGGTPSAVSGTVTATNQSITASDENGSNAEMLSGLIQTDAPIQAGDSGGPLVDLRGRVIGMDTAASTSNQIAGSAASLGFAIPIGSAQTIAATIQRGQTTDRVHIGETGFLGVQVQPDQGTGAPGSIGSGTGTGATVQSVLPGSPAAQVGLTGGDVITGVDGTTITSSSSLTASLRGHHPHDAVPITWTDAGGASHSATVTLAVGPAA